MFRIVEDDYPPLPENISEEMHDFLLCCFQKNPEERSSSKDLQEHLWITKNLKIKQKNVVNGSNDLGLYHQTDEQSHANKMARVTTTQELEQYYSSNVTEVMPIFDESSDDNDHKFVKNTLNIECKVCNQMVNEDSKLCEGALKIGFVSILLISQ
ncbi:hypothetical protein G6F56_012940 [Rhizopus delemar]|nr:hypothetical protein G6F56_012940 [Rhizopus delemar]